MAFGLAASPRLALSPIWMFAGLVLFAIGGELVIVAAVLAFLAFAGPAFRSDWFRAARTRTS